MTVLRYADKGNHVPVQMVETTHIHLLPGTELGIELGIITPDKQDYKLVVTLHFENPNVTSGEGADAFVRIIRFELQDILDLAWHEWKEMLESYDSIDYLSFFTGYHIDSVDDVERYKNPIHMYSEMLSQIFAKHCKLKLYFNPSGKYGGTIEAELAIGEKFLEGEVSYHSVRNYVSRDPI